MSVLLTAAMLVGLVAPDSGNLRDDAAIAPVVEQSLASAPSAASDPVAAAAPIERHTGIHTLFSGLIEDVKHLPSMPNLYIAAGGGALALAVHPSDTSANASLRSHVDFTESIWKPGHIVGAGYVEVGAAVATFAYGRVFGSPKASHLGMDLLRAEII